VLISKAGGIAGGGVVARALGGIAKPDRGVAGVESCAGTAVAADGLGLVAGIPGAGEPVADRPIAGSAKPDGGVKSVGDTKSAEPVTDADGPVIGEGIAWDGVEPPVGEPLGTPKGGAPKGTEGAGLAENPVGGKPNGAGVSPVIGDPVRLCAAKPVGGVGSGAACGLRPAKPDPGNAAPGKPAGAGSGVLGCVGVGSWGRRILGMVSSARRRPPLDGSTGGIRPARSGWL
jgi:hypothetical protein